MRISYPRFFLFLAFALLVIVLAVTLWVQTAVRAITSSQAQASAERWVTQLELSVPELPALLTDGLTTEEQRKGIEATLVGSQVFEIQFFDRDGTKIFDTNGEADRQLGEVNPRAAEVVSIGKTDISCSVPDDHIDPRRSALFVARSMLREIRDGGTDAYSTA